MPPVIFNLSVLPERNFVNLSAQCKSISYRRRKREYERLDNSFVLRESGFHFRKNTSWAEIPFGRKGLGPKRFHLGFVMLS